MHARQVHEYCATEGDDWRDAIVRFELAGYTPGVEARAFASVDVSLVFEAQILRDA